MFKTHHHTKLNSTEHYTLILSACPNTDIRSGVISSENGGDRERLNPQASSLSSRYLSLVQGRTHQLSSAPQGSWSFKIFTGNASQVNKGPHVQQHTMAAVWLDVTRTLQQTLSVRSVDRRSNRSLCIK